MSDNREIKWATLHDLTKPIPSEVLDAANEQAWRYVWDAANWEIEQSSTTSGMYGKWYFGVSRGTTVKDIRLTPPRGVGGDLQEAIENFTERMKEFCDENDLK